MPTESDYYSVLGVLPDAEAVVITAAYRALANLYHPDRCQGNLDEATKRMADINVAYEALRDEKRRKQYDESRTTKHANFSQNDDAQDTAFTAALGQLEESWAIAVEIYPDLAITRKKLAKISHKLAFAYVTVVLTSKRFNDRNQIFEMMEAEFLARYFGSNKQVIKFARQLIDSGNREAIKRLNQYVDVLGASIDPSIVIQKISSAFNVPPQNGGDFSKNGRPCSSNKYDVKNARTLVENERDVGQAIWLAEVHGYSISKKGGAFKPKRYTITDISSNVLIDVELDLSEDDFVNWVIKNC